EVTVDELAQFDGIVISPGPGTPDDAGVSNDAVRALSGKTAILGVCLGHQCIGQVFGGEVVRNEPAHGKTSWIHHDNSGVLGRRRSGAGTGPGPMIESLAKLVKCENLTEDEAAAAFEVIMRGDATPAQIAGFMVALRMKGETAEELTGFARTARAVATPIEVEGALLDTCGTGGDGLATFNIST